MRLTQSSWWGTKSLEYSFGEFREHPQSIYWIFLTSYFLGVLLFWRANRIRAMVPTDKAELEDFKAQRPLTGHPRFSCWFYVLELVLPVVKFGQDNAWSPNPELHNRKVSLGWNRAHLRVKGRWLIWARRLLLLLGWITAIVVGFLLADALKP